MHKVPFVENACLIHPRCLPEICQTFKRCHWAKTVTCDFCGQDRCTAIPCPHNSKVTGKHGYHEQTVAELRSHITAKVGATKAKDLMKGSKRLATSRS